MSEPTSGKTNRERPEIVRGAIVVALGLGSILMGVFMALLPERFFALVDWDTRSGQLVAAAIRGLLGLVVGLSAPPLSGQDSAMGRLAGEVHDFATRGERAGAVGADDLCPLSHPTPARRRA